MVKIDSTQKNIDQIKEIGLSNLELMPQVEKWCIHLNVEGYARGMVAQAFQIPNNVKLDCQHAGVPSDWMRLSVIAEEFIERNCLDCKFHEAREKPNYGEVIVTRIEQRNSERSAKQELEKDLAEKIRLEAANLINAGKSKANTTQISILKLLSEMADEDRRSATAAKLAAAAVLDPLFFSDDAINVLLIYFADEKAGADCISAACAVLAGRSYFPVNAFEVAKGQIATSPHFDQLARVLNFYISPDNFEADEKIIEVLISRLWYKRNIGESANPKRNFQNSEELLIRLLKEMPEKLVPLFRRKLAVNEKYTRININLLLQRLIPVVPEFVIKLTTEIILSLELTDDQYEESADGTTLDTIQALIEQDPSGTMLKLDETLVKLSVQARTLLPRLSIKLLEDRAFADNHPAISSKLIDELVKQVLSSDVPDEIQTETRHRLSYFVNQRPELFQSNFDGFLGYLSKVAEEESLFKFYQQELQTKEPAERTTFNYLSGLGFFEVQNIEHAINDRYRETKMIIGALCRATPQVNVPKVYSIIPGISSVKNEKYKNELIAIITDYAKDPAVLAGFIPQLYTHLLDPESEKIRFSALQFLNKVFTSYPMLVTSSLWDLWEVFLNDKAPGIKGFALVILGTVAEKFPERVTPVHLKIHREAIFTNWLFQLSNAIDIAANLRPFMNQTERYDMTALLLRIADIYSKNDDDIKLTGVIDQILSFVSDQPKAIFNIVSKYLCPRISKIEYYHAKEELEKLWYLSRKTPEIKRLWLEGVLTFMTRFPYEGGGGQDERLDLYFKMHHLEKKFIDPCMDKFRHMLTLPGTAMERHFEVAHLLGILGYFECYAELVDITANLKIQFGDVESNKYIRRNIEFWELVASAEIRGQIPEKLTQLKAAAHVFKS